MPIPKSNKSRSKFDCTSTILSNKEIAKSHFKLTLSCSPIALRVHPGQFVTVRIDNRLDPLLRRPFSVYRTKSNQLEIVYQVVGRGTKILSTKYPGEKLQILGPIGNGFTIPRETSFATPSSTSFATLNAILIGGGVGIASLMLLAIELRKRKVDVIALIGVSNKHRLIGVDDLVSIGAEVSVATEDGSAGYHGLVTELLEKKLRRDAKRERDKMRHTPHTTHHAPLNHQSPITNLFMYACGPHGMLKTVAEIALAKGIPAQLSFESHMACGVGACLGCVIKTKTSDGKSEYKRVCQDGPVFNAQEVVFPD